MNELKRAITYWVAPVKVRNEYLKLLEQLEHQARIGRATIKWFKKDKIMEYTGVEIWNEQELLDWAED